MAIILIECVPLTISCHLYFLRISKVSSMLHCGFSVKSATLYLHILSCFFFFFHQKYRVFIIFILLWSVKFPQQNISQSEIGIGDFQWNCMYSDDKEVVWAHKFSYNICKLGFDGRWMSAKLLCFIVNLIYCFTTSFTGRIFLMNRQCYNN